MSMEKTEILPLVSIQDFRIVEMESNKVLFDAYLDIWHKFDSPVSSVPDVAEEISENSQTFENCWIFLWNIGHRKLKKSKLQ